MAYSVEYKGITFIEGPHPGAKIIESASVDLSFKVGAQLKTLRDVKDRLVEQAIHSGANAVINFTYGQKSRWFAIDDVAFWGKGDLAIIETEVTGS